MKREAALLSIGILLGSGIGLGLGLRPVPPAPATTPAVSGTQPQQSTVSTPSSGAPATTTPSTAAAPDPDRPPAAALAALLSAPNPLNNWSEITTHLTLWAERDPRATLDYVARAPRFPMRNSAMAIPLAAMARTDPAPVADWLRRNVGETDRRRITDEIVSTIAESNPHEALALSIDPSLNSESYLCAYALGHLASTSPADALEVYATLPGPTQTQAAQLIGDAWAKLAPQAALSWCESLTDAPARNAAATGIIDSLAMKDPQQAAAALVRLHPSSEATCSALRTLAQSNPALALSCIPQLPSEVAPAAAKAVAASAFWAAPDQITAVLCTKVPQAELPAVLQQRWNDWREYDRKAADEWAEALAAPTLRGYLLDQQLNASAESDPAAFLASVDAVPGADLERNPIQKALKNLPPAEAARWIATHPNQVATTTAASIASAFVQQDSTAASTWAFALPPGELRDQALAGVATSCTGERTAIANQALDTIADAKSRTRARFEIYQSLLTQNSESARAWLATQPLSPEVRETWETIASTIRPSPDDGSPD